MCIRDSFSDEGVETRPAFSNEWVCEKILKTGVFDGLNEQARLIVYALIETGCRPSEIANLTAEDIHLDVDVPYISIRPKAKRQLKSKSSKREIPLVGVSLEAMKQAPDGFPHYRDKSSLLSSSLMKAFRVRRLLEINQAGQQVVTRALSRKPTLRVRPGWRFGVVVNRDLVLSPYNFDGDF